MHKIFIGNELKMFNDKETALKEYYKHELKINKNYYIDYKYFGKALFVSLHDNKTNKKVKMLYKNLDITKEFTIAGDGLYYNEAWSKNGRTIDVDGLGWGIETIREYLLEYEVLNNISDQYESIIDDIRYVTQ